MEVATTVRLVWGLIRIVLVGHGLVGIMEGWVRWDRLLVR
jgi:hypothetical protein